MKREWWYWHDRHVQFLIVKTIALIYSAKKREIRKMLERRERSKYRYKQNSFDKFQNPPNI